MWTAFKNWLSSRLLNRHRLLFRYWNGSRFVSADPFVLLRRMLASDKFDPEKDLKLLEVPDPKVFLTRIGWIAEGVREIFGLPALEDGGLAELECVNLLMEFSRFMDRVKKNGAANPILPSPMGLSPFQSPKQDAGSAGVNDMKESLAST